MVKRTIFGVVAFVLLVLAVFAAVVAMQPAEFVVARSATMAAPPDKVFAQVNDFQNWNGWSPWAKLDPQAKYTLEGPPAGEGAIYRWSGNKDVGEGSMTILESKPSEHVRMKLEFIRPFPDSCNVDFALKPEGDKTSLTWTMSGRNEDFVSKAFCLVMNMDKMVGGDFEKGLASMKAIVEAPASAGEKKIQNPDDKVPAATEIPVQVEN